MLKSFAHPLLNRFVPLFALAAVFLAPSRAQAVEGRGGLLLAEGPGVWLEGRQRLGKTDLGIHLAGSTIDLEVMRNGGEISNTDQFGQTSYTTAFIPGRVTAFFYEWGLVAARKVHSAERWNLGLTTGIMGGLLDGTEDERVMGPASVMILVPAIVEIDWHPLPDWKRLGLTIAAGGVWTTPGDEDELYPEVSPWRWQIRSGVLF